MDSGLDVDYCVFKRIHVITFWPGLIRSCRFKTISPVSCCKTLHTSLDSQPIQNMAQHLVRAIVDLDFDNSHDHEGWQRYGHNIIDMKHILLHRPGSTVNNPVIIPGMIST